MSKYRTIADERMMKACEFIIKNNVNDISLIKEWCVAIGMTPNNINKIKDGRQSFSSEHIRACCVKFNVSANFIFGLSSQMFRQPAKETPISKIENALQELKQTLKKNNH